MATTHGRDPEHPPLNDPEHPAGRGGPGVSERKVLGIPAWAALVGAVIVSAILWALLLLLQ